MKHLEIILEQKEKESGIEYNVGSNPSSEVVEGDSGRPSLGMAETVTSKMEEKEEGQRLAAEAGWKNIPLDTIPSGGLFYPDNTEIAIRPCSVSEIRHFSTIDDNDAFDVDDKLNFIMDKCIKTKFKDKASTWKDLKEEDRFYLIFTVRDITFKKGENKMSVNIGCGNTCAGDGSFKEKIELRSDVFSYYEIDQRLMKYYSPEDKCFNVKSSNNKVGNFQLYVPSLGITAFIKNFIRKKVQAGEHYDKAFVKFAPFLFDDWRTINDSKYLRTQQDSFG